MADTVPVSVSAGKHQAGVGRGAQGKKSSVHADGYAWVKYGEKKLTPSKMTREYYRCKHWRGSGAHSQGCPARKVVDRPSEDDDDCHVADGKKKARAVFPRHSPSQSPEFSQHNHPPEAPRHPHLAFLSSGQSALPPSAASLLSLGALGGARSDPWGSPNPLLMPSGNSIRTPLAQAGLLSSYSQSLFDNASPLGSMSTGWQQQENTASATSSGTPCSRKRPPLLPLLIPDLAVAPPEPCANALLAEVPPASRPGPLYSDAASLLLKQQARRSLCLETASEYPQGCESLVLRQMGTKRQRLDSPLSTQTASLNASLRESTLPSPLCLKTFRALSSLSSAECAHPSPSDSLDSNRPCGLSGENVAARLSELSDDALVALLDLLSGQIATSIGTVPSAQISLLSSLL